VVIRVPSEFPLLACELANGRPMPYGRDMPTIRTPAGEANGYDYEADETLVVSQPVQLRAVANDVRAEIIARLRDRARSTQQLSEELGIPKGTVGHHLNVLEKAGLIRVVRTRRVRAVTEKFYGRTARLFLFRTEDPADERALGATMLRQAAGEIERAPEGATFGQAKARLTHQDMVRLERRLKRLFDDFRAAESPDGTPCTLAAALYKQTNA
jgi:DNA-binding transcriptional ArsR family regulator